MAAMSQVMLDERTRLRNTTVAKIVAARGSLDDPETKKECCRRLQKINNMLKDRIAEMDATMARDAMHAGILKGGFSGCDNSKLIAVLCTRTKASLNRTKAQYRAKFDRDLCKDVKSKTGSDYGRMMGHALSDPDEYVADVIHAACHGMGCDENALIELCMTRSPEQLEAGKKCWEGRRDKALFDYIGKELGMLFKDLKHLILEILKGKRNWTGPVDKKRAAHHAERLHHECTKNMFQNFHEVLTQCPFLNVSELQVRVDGADAMPRLHDHQRVQAPHGIDPRRTVSWTRPPAARASVQPLPLSPSDG